MKCTPHTRRRLSCKVSGRHSRIAAIPGLLGLAFGASAAQWSQTTSLPEGFQEHVLVCSSNFLYNIGGSGSSNGVYDGTNVFYSQILPNGAVGPWNRASPLPEPVLDAAAVSDRGFIYLLGGNHYTAAAGEVPTNIVYRAAINPNGSLGAWQAATPLPQSLYWLGASVWNHVIYTTGGADTNDEPVDIVNSATINADGSLSAWTALAPLPAAVYAHSQAANGTLYLFGGVTNSSSAVSSDVWSCPINSDGSLASWSCAAPLPQGLCLFASVTAAGRVFTVAGWNGSAFLDNFYNAPVTGDGSLPFWSAGTPLPQSLIYLAAAVGGTNLFVSGGANYQSPSSAVYSMPLPIPSPPRMAAQSVRTNGAVQLTLSSLTNTGFAILASTNFTNWTNIGWALTGTNGALVFQDTNAPAFPRRFYRASWPLP
jgi:N-acetylneuraminic acid mutarotase